MKKILVFTTFFILFLASCSKDDDTSTTIPSTPNIQNPIIGFLLSTGLNQETIQTSAACNEFGYSFIPLVNGKITSIIVKLPVAYASRVTLWNKQTGAILYTEIINVASANTEITRNITPINLVNNTEYLLSFNSGDYYIHQRIGNNLPSIAYPITVDDIKITSHVYGQGTSHLIPSITRTNNFIGDCNFIFEKLIN